LAESAEQYSVSGIGCAKAGICRPASVVMVAAISVSFIGFIMLSSMAQSWAGEGEPRSAAQLWRSADARLTARVNFLTRS